MKASRYMFAYLQGNDALGFRKGLTASTYLHRNLSQWERRRAIQIQKDLVQSLNDHGAIPGPSVRGGIAYYSRENVDAVVYAGTKKLMGGAL